MDTDLALLEELTTMGMALARHVQAQALATTEPQPLAAATRAFAQVARSVRQGIALKHRILNPATPRSALPPQALSRRKRLRELLHQSIRGVSPDRLHDLTRHIDERLDTLAPSPEFLAREFHDLIAEIATSLGITLDASDFTDEELGFHDDYTEEEFVARFGMTFAESRALDEASAASRPP